MAASYPLDWPKGIARAKWRDENSHFKRELTIPDAYGGLCEELEKLGATGAVISTNLEVSSVLRPRGDRGRPQDPGVAVYFQLDKQPYAMTCDRWERVQHNMRALALHLEAMRGMERWGVGSGRQAFAGYRALPDPASAGGETPFKILGVPEGADANEINRAWREKIRDVHPDLNGGTNEAAIRINRARDQALALSANGVTA